MKTKQLLCLLVLTVSGNAFGSSTTQATNVTEMANQHFAPLTQGMSMQNPIMTRMNDICRVLNTDLMKQCMQLLQAAYQEGVNAGLMAAGTHMQATMTAMGNVVKAQRPILSPAALQTLGTK